MIRLLCVCAVCFTSACFAAEGEPAGGSPPVTPEASAKQKQLPRRWLARTGKYFERQEDGRWNEVTRTGAVEYVFQEDEVTPEYTDLIDRSRNLRVRLQNRGADWRIDVPEGPWNELTRGGWHTGAAPEPVEPKAPEKAPRTEAEKAALAKAIEEVVRFIEENPDAPLDMSHLKNLGPELAKVLICTDEEIRPVRRVRKVPYTVRVHPKGDNDAPPTEETREKPFEYKAEVPGRALRLNGIQSLTSETADVLGQHCGDLELNGLRELSEEIAAWIHYHQGVLFLDAVETMSTECAEHLASHDGPVSLRGIKRLSAEAYDTLIDNRSLNDSFAAWLPSTIIIEAETVPEPFVRWSVMAATDTVERYVNKIAAQADVEILVDDEALRRCKLSVSDMVSAPVGDVLKVSKWGTTLWGSGGFATKGSFRMSADVMGLEEAVVWIASELNDHLKKDSKESIVVLTNGHSFLLTARPKTDEKREPLAQRPAPEEIELSKGEKSLWYRCQGEPLFQQAELIESGWQPPWRFGGGGMGGMGGGFCWVAREVYGERDPRWLLFREWLLCEAPEWLLKAYGRHGQDFARWIHDKPAAKSVVRLLMDAAIANRVATLTSLAR